MKKAGGILTIIWIIGSLYLAGTAVEMEILIALYFAVIGGFVVVTYFLLIWVINAYRKQEKYRIRLLLFIFWLVAPFLFYTINEIKQNIENEEYLRQLESNAPTAEFIRNFSATTPYLSEDKNFFTYSDRVLTLVYKVNKGQALTRFELLHKGRTNKDEIQEVIIEDFIGREILSVHMLHFSLWNETLHPQKIIIQVFYDGELFYETTSIKGEEPQLDDFMKKHQELYERFKVALN